MRSLRMHPLRGEGNGGWGLHDLQQTEADQLSPTEFSGGL